jgi:hypothetical protein
VLSSMFAKRVHRQHQHPKLWMPSKEERCCNINSAQFRWHERFCAAGFSVHSNLLKLLKPHAWTSLCAQITTMSVIGQRSRALERVDAKHPMYMLHPLISRAAPLANRSRRLLVMACYVSKLDFVAMGKASMQHLNCIVPCLCICHKRAYKCSGYNNYEVVDWRCTQLFL